MGKNTYYANFGTEDKGVFVQVSRQALLQMIQIGQVTDYLIRGDKVAENLNWLTELSAADGWHQNEVDKRGDRAVVIRVTGG